MSAVEILSRILDAIDDYAACYDLAMRIHERFEVEHRQALATTIEAKRKLFELRDEARKEQI